VAERSRRLAMVNNARHARQTRSS